MFLLSFIVGACKDDDENPFLNCDEEVLISSDQYQNAPDDHLQINKVEILDDCLHIQFSSGGCNGDTWEIKLIDQGAILKTNPPQRNLRLSLKNEELCDAWIQREISFDIRSLKYNNSPILLNITNSGDQVLYR